MSARRTGTKFRLATRGARQAVLVQSSARGGVCEIVARTTRFRMNALFSASYRVLVVWGQLQTYVRFRELHLLSWCEVVANLFPRVDYQVVACSWRGE